MSIFLAPIPIVHVQVMLDDMAKGYKCFAFGSNSLDFLSRYGVIVSLTFKPLKRNHSIPKYLFNLPSNPSKSFRRLVYRSLPNKSDKVDALCPRINQIIKYEVPDRDDEVNFSLIFKKFIFIFLDFTNILSNFSMSLLF